MAKTEKKAEKTEKVTAATRTAGKPGKKDEAKKPEPSKLKDVAAAVKGKKAEKPAKKAAKAEKPAKKAKADKEPRKKGGDLADKKIKLLVKENPKRGKSAERFGLYKSGQRVHEFIAAGGTLGDVKYDLNKKFIALSA